MCVDSYTMVGVLILEDINIPKLFPLTLLS